jgi:16S rRNA (adenine1518-N6/adenine1519-N6)-dimethyltransferase
MHPHGKAHQIELKKKYGQHFLRDQRIVDHMIEAVPMQGASILEIGPGDGFLTRSILAHPIARLWAFEIDHDWVTYLTNAIKDDRLTIIEQDILTVDFGALAAHAPWIVLANLPYQITFGIMHLLQQHRHLLQEGVVMMQEEVAQKLVKTSGRGYSCSSLFFQYYFEFKLLDKIPPTAFYPAPKVWSRLLYFKPKQQVAPIANEEAFWKFIKTCFHQPRRTLRNNLSSTHYPIDRLSADVLAQRAQQLDIEQLLEIWHKLS